jgi:DnaJ-class molecular chaperone
VAKRECGTCDGTGKYKGSTCQTCQGTGEVEDARGDRKDLSKKKPKRS